MAKKNDTTFFENKLRRIVLWNGAFFFVCNGAVGTDVLTALFFGGTYGRFDFEFASN